MQSHTTFGLCALIGLMLTMMEAGFGQERPANQVAKKPLIEVQTTLVMVPAIVTDRSGKHVEGLKREGFEVLQDGKVQRIGIFRHVQTTAERMKLAETPPGGLTNVLEGNDQRMTIFVIDFLNSSFSEQRLARQEVLKFLSRTIDVKEPISLLALDQTGVKVIHDFTMDPAVLAEALKKVTERPSPKDQPQGNPIEDTYRMTAGWNSRSSRRNAAMEQSRLDMLANATIFQAVGSSAQVAATLQALREIGEAFTGIPGRKSMVWATGRFPFEIDDATQFGLHDRGLLPAYAAAWHALNGANIAVYPLDVEDLVDTAYVDPRTGEPLPQHIHMNLNVTKMEKFAEVTGSKFCDRRENAESCFRQAAGDSSDYYLIGIYPDSADSKPGWKKLSVRVHQTDLRVQSKSGYYEGPPADDKQRISDDIKAALNTPFDYTAIPLGVQWKAAAVAGDDGKKRINFMYELAPGIATLQGNDHNHLSLEFAAVARDAKGLPQGTFSKGIDGHLGKSMAIDILADGVRFPGTMQLPPGEYTFTFVVRDNLSQRIGSVSSVVTVP